MTTRFCVLQILENAGIQPDVLLDLGGGEHMTPYQILSSAINGAMDEIEDLEVCKV